MSASARSSSGSWAGEARAERRGARADIIDLDKFMRGAVRPPRPRPPPAARAPREELVVDAGGVERKVAKVGAVRAARALSAASASSSSASAPRHGKRFSHDSGLSDGSSQRRARERGRGRGPRAADAARAPSAASLRAFRAVCERALLDQQELQVARVQAPLPAGAPRQGAGAAVTDSTAQCEAGGGGFALDDPVRLYAQAKELQALPAAAARAGQHVGEHVGAQVGQRAGAQAGGEPSLCALCRGYWRWLRQYVAAQMWCGPADAADVRR